MLRRGRCWPADEIDSAQLGTRAKDQRYVELRSTEPQDADTWRHWGWTLIEDEAQMQALDYMRKV